MLLHTQIRTDRHTHTRSTCRVCAHTHVCISLPHLPAHMYVIPAALSITHTLAWLLSDAHIQVPWILLSNWTVCWQGLWVLNDCQICHRPKRFIFSLNLLISCQESPLQCDQPAGIMLYNCNHKKQKHKTSTTVFHAYSLTKPRMKHYIFTFYLLHFLSFQAYFLKLK